MKQRHYQTGVTSAALVLMLALLPAILLADIVVLKNGNRLEGEIRSEDARQIKLYTGSSELVISRDQIESIERTVSTDLQLRAANRSLVSARELIASGMSDSARRTLDGAILKIDEAMADMPEPKSAELMALRRQLDELRMTTLPKDPRSVEGEQNYREALKHLDHVDYQRAFASLRKAAELVPERNDIQFRLATVAERLQNPNEAIKAYQAALRAEPETYYSEAAQPLLRLLKGQGRRLLAERRPTEAVEIFQEILLLEGSGENPTDLTEYVTRKTSRDQKTQDQVLMEVYRYADDNDLVDLAFAAVNKASSIKPEDREIARIAREMKFLSDLKTEIDTGNLEKAAEILMEAPQEVRDAEKVKARVEKIAGAVSADLEAEKLFLAARNAFDAEDFASAIESARKVIERYPQSSAAADALQIVEKAEIELPIKKGFADARALLDTTKYDDAEAELRELTTLKGFDDSRYAQQIRDLLGRIPEEREADRLWMTAKVSLDQKDYDAALEVLDTITLRYGNTRAGQKASEWLRDYRLRLQREAEKDRIVSTQSFFAFADLDLWRAASDPAVPRQNRQVLPPVPEEARGKAWETFRTLKFHESTAHPDRRSALLYILLPAVLGIAVLGFGAWKVGLPGKGKYKELDDTPIVDPATAGGNYSDVWRKTSSCRMCGGELKIEHLSCPTCKAPVQLSSLEKERQDAMTKAANYDPWEIRVKPKEVNDYQKHFDKAKDLAQTSDVQAAIEQCRMALHEDPQRKDGYLLLAELYERAGKADEAAKCYREVLLIDPTEVIVRQKVESLLSLVNLPVANRDLIITVSALTWWMVFWLVMGLDPHYWFIRLPLCIAGCALTVIGWIRLQRIRKLEVEARDKGDIDVHRPLPRENLSWSEQNRQAKMIAEAIREHTGIEVPVLSCWRIVGVAILSVLMLVVCLLVGWVNSSPWVLLSWPAGVLVFFYLLELHPRLVTAHIVLRHVFEETASPWVDPHRPFKPGEGAEYAGEFLIRDVGELPLRWALNPFPYAPTRQGLLNSIQQTLNRHWACHRFYKGLHIVRDVEIPALAGCKSISLLTTLLLVAGFCAAIAIGWFASSAERRYEGSLNAGYLSMLEGNLERARSEFQTAAMLKRDRALPLLYLAHANNSSGYKPAAERAFRAASRRAHTLPVVHNDYANFLQREGRFQEATREYLAALKEDSQNADVLSNLGSALFKMGDYRKAAEYLEQAVRFETRHSRAYTTMGLAYEEMGQFVKAKEAFQKAVEVAPDVPYTQVARDRLQLLEQGKEAIPTIEALTPSGQVTAGS